MPGTGGTYLYLREAFRKTRLGGILPFLFIWQFIFSGPLEIASGYIGFSQYVGYFWRGMSPAEARLVNVAVGALVIVLLYRRITAVGRITVALWIGVLVTMLWIIVSGLANFHARVAFDFPPDAFTLFHRLRRRTGLRHADRHVRFHGLLRHLLHGRRSPRPGAHHSPLHHLLRAGRGRDLLADEPEHHRRGAVARGHAIEVHCLASSSRRLYGPRAAAVATVLVLWTAFASVFALLLGYSRIPYAAAADGHFFRVFARLHPSGKFPHVSLLAMGLLSIGASFGSLDAVISALLTSRILVQFIAQIFALDRLRKTPPGDCPAFPHVAVSRSERNRLCRLDVHFPDLGLGIHRIRPADVGHGRGGVCDLEAGPGGVGRRATYRFSGDSRYDTRRSGCRQATVVLTLVSSAAAPVDRRNWRMR